MTVSFVDGFRTEHVDVAAGARLRHAGAGPLPEQQGLVAGERSVARTPAARSRTSDPWQSIFGAQGERPTVRSRAARRSR